MVLNILKILPDTIVDGPRMRTSIYLSGCSHHCPGCHNPSSWKQNGGKDIEIDEIILKVKEYDHNRITISGGDGLCYQASELIEFVKKIRSEIPTIDIWLYTGFTWEQIEHNPSLKEILPFIDVLCDGPFVESLKSPQKLWVGSSNQRVIDVRKSLQENKIIELV